MKQGQKGSNQTKKVDTGGEPLMVSTAAVSTAAAASDATATRTRRNKAGSIQRTDKYTNIENGLVPFKYSTGSYGSNNSNIDVRDAVILCQKAYYNFSIFRNSMDLMTEFSSNDIFLRGGSKKSRDFFKAFFNKINMWSLQDKFFREYYRSGNVFLYRFDAKIQKSDLNKMTQTFGVSKAKKTYVIPSKYVMLNPADIQVGGNISFSSGKYYKVLSDYELERLKNPTTEEDKEVLENLPKEVKELIKQKVTSVAIPLDAEKLSAVFYKRQDYEPMAVPMGYPVLEDINWKAELKKMDMAVTRTMQQTVLLVTMGAEPDKGGINHKNLAAMQALFENESVGRVLIADYTTKAEFVVPKISDLLDPRKYEIVDRDITMGLNAIITGVGERFANQSSRVELFVARLTKAREAFLNDFLIPEIKRIAKDLGFKNYPAPYFEPISLTQDDTITRIYSRLIELGILTPEEGIEALESGKLPNGEESAESQEKYLKLKKKGFYEPMTGGPNTQKELADKTIKSQEKQADEQLKQAEKTQKQELKVREKEAKKPNTNNIPNSNVPQESGRPPGTGTPQSTKNIKPVGADYHKFSLETVKENFIKADKVFNKICGLLKRKHKVKKLSETQTEIAHGITSVVIANEEAESWEAKAKDYVKNPVDTNKKRIKEIRDIAYTHQVDDYLASILYASKI
jgi:hypothetical protein